MARREIINAESVEAEIQRLKESDYVKLAQMEQRIKQDRRRKQMYQLRWYEKRGKELAAAGVTRENMHDYVDGMLDDMEGPDNAECVV